ncbi:MAG: hypothetical protein WCI48_11590 [Bacteroidota bacterium]
MKTLSSKVKQQAILIGIIMILLLPAGTFCQDKQNPSQKPQQQAKTVTSEQASTIKKILSKYNASTLTAADAKAIMEQFKQAGIHAGPETGDAIRAAGFDPEKLKSLAPPPDAGNQGKQNPPSAEERMKNTEANVIKPLGLNASQNEVVTKAYKDFYADTETLMKTQGNASGPPDKSKVEPLRQKRDDKIRQVLTADQYKKYQDLERANHPQGGNEQGSKQK